jgi:hypothetical protein
VTFDERFIFPYRAEIDYRLEAAGPVRSALLDLSSIAPLDCGFCTISEERIEDGERVGFVRRIRVIERLVDGDSLAELPAMFERYDEARQVVARFVS